MQPVAAQCPPCVQYTPQPPSQRKLERVPYQKKVIQYEEYEYQERVPRQVVHTQYDEVKKVEMVPVTRTVTDYYAVQVVRQLIPQVQKQTKVEMVPVERTIQKMVYKPVVRKVVHKPQEQQASYIAQSELKKAQPVLYPYARSYIEEPRYTSTYPSASKEIYTSGLPYYAFGPLTNQYDHILQNNSIGDNLRYSQFYNAINSLSKVQIPDGVASSVWDRAANGSTANVKDLARVMKQLSLDNQQVKGLFQRAFS